jgi:hypothetical protein
MKREPKNCPWCAAIPKIQAWHGGPKTKRLVSCDNDFCAVGPMVSGRTRAVAVALWNKRRNTPDE